MENSFYIFFRIMLYDVSKQYAYNNLYNMLHFFKNFLYMYYNKNNN